MIFNPKHTMCDIQDVRMFYPINTHTNPPLDYHKSEIKHLLDCIVDDTLNNTINNYYHIKSDALYTFDRW